MSRIIFILLLSIFSRAIQAYDSLQFSGACRSGEMLTLAAAGDILLHLPLQIIGQQKGFMNLWQSVVPVLHSVDIAYANLEGPINPNNSLGTGYPLFGYPNDLAYALKESGFSIVSTANNHSLDQKAAGVDNTIKTLQRAQMAYVGTRSRHSNGSWVHIMNKKNFKIAWIACTDHINDNEDLFHQVLRCYKKKDFQWILQTIQELKNKVDIIIVTPHWGDEYESFPNTVQKQWAHRILNAGATIILGSHPHVLQPFEKFYTADGRETAIIYSLGNFVSYQGTLKKRTTVLLLLGFRKKAQKTVIAGMQFVPLYMQNRNGLNNITLHRLPTDNLNSVSFQVISAALPLGNISYNGFFNDCH